MKPAAIRFRDAFQKFVPWWLADGGPGEIKRATKVLFAMIAPLDTLAEVYVEGISSWFPGLGTPSALPLIGRSRGIPRGQADTDDGYGARLRGWLDRWRTAGSALSLALAIHEFLGNAPRVRIVNRAGYWVTVEHDGSISRTRAAWDWDSVSNPERAAFWSEQWVIVYPTEWAVRPAGSLSALTVDDGFALGHLASRQEVDIVLGLIDTWKAAHTLVRAVIWTSDPALFDPAVPSSLPDGTWGQWGSTGGGSRRAGGRNLASCRYWEPT